MCVEDYDPLREVFGQRNVSRFHRPTPIFSPSRSVSGFCSAVRSNRPRPRPLRAYHPPIVPPKRTFPDFQNRVRAARAPKTGFSVPFRCATTPRKYRARRRRRPPEHGFGGTFSMSFVPCRVLEGAGRHAAPRRPNTVSNPRPASPGPARAPVSEIGPLLASRSVRFSNGVMHDTSGARASGIVPGAPQVRPTHADVVRPTILSLPRERKR